MHNFKGGVIEGSKHALTGDFAATIINDEGATLRGNNGGGVNWDNLDSGGASTGLVSVYNRGTITGSAIRDVSGDDPEDVDIDGDGIDIDGEAYIENWGRIEGLGAKGFKDTFANHSEAVAAGGGTIINQVGGVIYSVDTAIRIDNGEEGPAVLETEIINKGTIEARDGEGVVLVGNFDDLIRNSGTIKVGAGQTAVDMGDGEDDFRLIKGGTVIGDVKLGDGADTFVLDVDGTTMNGTVDGGNDNDKLKLKGVGTFDVADYGSKYLDFQSLLIADDGVVTLTGETTESFDLTVDGNTRVNAGMSNVGVTVEDGGFVGGNATFASLVMQSGSILSPGNSIGTTTVLGDAEFNAGSFYEVELSGTNADLIDVGGTATINGGTIKLSALGPVEVGFAYTILQSDNPVIVNAPGFDAIDNSLLFLDATLDYVLDPNKVMLTLARNATAFDSVAETENQKSVAAALMAADPTDDVVGAVVGVSGADEARAAYDALSGQVHASLGNVMLGQSTLVGDTILSRLRQVPAGSDAQTASLGFGGPVTAYAAVKPLPEPFRDLKAAAPVGPVYATWAQGFGQWAEADGDGNAASVDGSVGGLLGGADASFDNLTFGLAGGFASADTDVDDLQSSAEASTAIIAAYAGTSFDALRLRAGGSYGWSEIDTERTVVAGGVTENPEANYDGSTANAFVEAAYAFSAVKASFEPFAQIGWSRIETDGFTEEGAPISGLTSDGMDFDTVYSTLGLRAATSFVSGGMLITPHGSLAWRHAFDDLTPELAMSFIGAGTGFSVSGTPIAENSLVFEAGVQVGISDNISAGIAYEGQFADEIQYNAVKANFSYRF